MKRELCKDFVRASDGDWRAAGYKIEPLPGCAERWHARDREGPFFRWSSEAVSVFFCLPSMRILPVHKQWAIDEMSPKSPCIAMSPTLQKKRFFYRNEYYTPE